jgi:hypothetical protein
MAASSPGVVWLRSLWGRIGFLHWFLLDLPNFVVDECIKGEAESQQRDNLEQHVVKRDKNAHDRRVLIAEVECLDEAVDVVSRFQEAEAPRELGSVSQYCTPNGDD